MAETWVLTNPGVPGESLFGTTRGQGTPIVIDSTTGKAYYSNDGVVELVSEQTSIVGITGTLAQFDAACTDANFLSTAAAAAGYQPLAQTVTGLAGAIGPTIADYFSATLSLEASSTYEIQCMAYFLKTTAGTVVWTWLCSSAPTMLSSFYTGTPATGFTTTTITGAQVTAEAHRQANTTMAHAATGSLTTAVYHVFNFYVTIRTNAATTIALRATESAGTITPQAGSYLRAIKLG